MKEKLTTRELIGAGAFGAIYVALLFVVSMILSMAPIALLLTPFVMGVIGATVYMVYVSKIQKTGPLFTLILAKEAVLETYKVYYGEAYANTIDKYTPSWGLFVFLALAVAVNGCVVGGRLLKKHFSRVGVAS